MGANGMLISIIFIAAASAAIIGGTYAYFSNTETSAGNTFAADTIDMQLQCPQSNPASYSVNLNPDFANDTTSSSIHNLDADELYELSASDNSRYSTKGLWERTYYDDSEYLEVSFPDIPSGAAITGANLNFEWLRRNGTSEAKLTIWDGSSWQTHPLPLPPKDTDDIAAVNLKSLYGIDTAAEVNALKIRFQAVKGSSNHHTTHDWAEIQINYTLSSGPNWCDSGINATFIVGDIKPGYSSSAPAIIKVKNAGEDDATVSIHLANLSNYDMGCTEPESGSGDATCGDPGPGDGELGEYLELSASLDSGPVVIHTLNELGANSYELGVLGAGEEKEIAISWSLPPATGNIVQSDKAEFDVEIILN